MARSRAYFVENLKLWKFLFFEPRVYSQNLRHPTIPRALVGGEVLFACPGLAIFHTNPINSALSAPALFLSRGQLSD